MFKHNIFIKNETETSFLMRPSYEFFRDSNSYLRPFEIFVELDADVQEYQYYIKDLVNQEILTAGWFKASDKITAKKCALGQLGIFIQNQMRVFENILSDIIDFRYDIINNKLTEEENYDKRTNE